MNMLRICKKKYKKPLYCAFMDYSKAFDLIPRVHFWTKLLSCNSVANVRSLYILGIGLGRWAVNRHETGSRRCCSDASVFWAVSWVAMSDSRLYRCRPPVVTRDSQAVYAKFLKETDMHDIKCVDIGVILADRGELGFSDYV